MAFKMKGAPYFDTNTPIYNPGKLALVSETPLDVFQSYP